jgi:hypothetical protein
LRARIDRIGPGRIDIGARLIDLFGTITAMQPVHDLLLGREIGFGFCHLRQQPIRVQSREHLAAFHMIAFLGQDLGDSLTAIEGQVNLAQIDIAIEHEFMAGVVVRRRPPP